MPSKAEIEVTKLAREAMMLGIADYNQVWEWFDDEGLDPEEISVRLARIEWSLERV